MALIGGFTGGLTVALTGGLTEGGNVGLPEGIAAVFIGATSVALTSGPTTRFTTGYATQQERIV